MEVQRYRIFELSARAVMSYAVEENGIYKYDLDAAAVDHCLVSSATHEQDSNALFFQILSEIHGRRYKETVTEDVSNELSEIVFYMNFQKVFDTRGLRQREITRQKKAECMFHPEGITLDFGSGPRRYLAFERSGNMSRESRLSFIREDFFAPVSKRIMMDLEIKSCQLSKLYAYNGLMLSSGKRIEGIGIEKKHRVIVVDNPKLKTEREFMVTVRDDGTNNSTRKFYRHEQLEEVNVTCFDGEGLISKAFAEKLDMAYCGQHIHSSFQIRMPYVKGIRDFFQENLAEYERRWRIKVRQFQIPIFLENTDAMWQIRFDDVIANALTLGPLREMEAELTEQQKEKLLPYAQGEIKMEYLTTLVAFYTANKPEDSDWVVLPSTNFNCYFGSTVFSKKVLKEIAGKVIQRSDTSYGSGRYRVLEEFL